MKCSIKLLILFYLLMLGTECSAQTISGSVGHYNYVDLGLPSGTKWATCNVGAEDPFEYGEYFSWGETETKRKYNWATYKWSEKKSSTQNKYCTNVYCGVVDSLTTLTEEDDAATTLWGSAWRIPTKQELEELLDGCTWVWTTNFNGSKVTGSIGTSKTNGNVIFLPAAGYKNASSTFKEGERGYYWSSTLNEEYSYDAYSLDINYVSNNLSNDKRSAGNSVRAVVK